jgi:hypothetical protein
MLFLNTKTQWRLRRLSKRELGGSRFSCIYLAPAIRAQIGATGSKPALKEDTERAANCQ